MIDNLAGDDGTLERSENDTLKRSENSVVLAY